jgi:DNA-binding NtrC family response regulator
LIAEDEEDLRFLYREHIESSGHFVTTAENGSEALELFKNSPQGYNLLLTEQLMPLMTGIELIEAVLKINVNIPIILATGYADMETIDQIGSKHAYKCLVKPINRNVLQETVYRCIDR